jgi:hypothetical protein
MPWFIRATKFSHHAFWHEYGRDLSSEGGREPNADVLADESSPGSSVRDVEAVEVVELKSDRRLTALPRV